MRFMGLIGGELDSVSGPSSSSMTSNSLSLSSIKFSSSSSIKFCDAIPTSLFESPFKDFKITIDCSHCLIASSTPLKSFKLQATKDRSIRPSRLSLLNWLRRLKILLDYGMVPSGGVVSVSLSESSNPLICFFWICFA